ncbi:MAG: LPS-assembly protein LptD [Thermodesulfovibrionales bacterium]
MTKNIQPAFFTLHLKPCPLFFLFTSIVILLFFTQIASADMVVESDILEYDANTTTYKATGKVKIIKDAATINADVVTYNEKTADVSADGNVLYLDPDVRIRASRAFFNLEKNTGKLIEAEIFYKKDNYHIKGAEMEKTSEKEYFLKGASFTTCDAPLPAWCFKGRDVHIILEETLKARDVTFHVKNLPVLYSPYLTAPLKDRKTGLLLPSIGFVESKGLHYEQPFYWAISDNRDATLTLDMYGKRAIGEGLEYRHIEQSGLKGNYWIYHLRDEKFNSDFWDIKALFDKRDGDITAFLNLNYINSLLYYREYNPYVNSRKAFLDPASYLNATTGRFYESTAEVKYRIGYSSLSFQSRYLIDLKEGVDQSTILQRLPEISYFRYPERIGPVTFTISSSATNFWREEGARGQRIDLYPKFLFSSGDKVIVTHALGLRATAYLLNRAEDSSDTIRTGFDYSVTALMRLEKRYRNFTHAIEPSIDYIFIPSIRSDVPFFDATEMYKKTSLINLSLMNRFLSSRGEFLTLRITQPFDTYRGDRPRLPLRIEASIKGPLTMRGELSYDPAPGTIEDLNSDLSLNLSNLWVSIGQRYKKTEDILYYSFGLKWNPPLKSLSYEGYFWYDAKTGNTKNIIARINYQKQCWGVSAIVTKRERDYSFSLLFNLLNIGTVKI